MPMFESFRRDQHQETERMQALGLGLLVGAILGVASALLLAPATGADTRKRLAKRARKAYHDGSEIVEESWDEAEHAARRAARAGMKRARRQAARLREMGEESIENGRKRMRV